MESDFSMKKDGEMWCATYPDFVNLQESPAGFGDSQRSALEDLLSKYPMSCEAPMWWGAGMPAGTCGQSAYGVEKHMRMRMPVERKIARCSVHGGPTLSEVLYKVDPKNPVRLVEGGEK